MGIVYKPQEYSIKDERMTPFIDEDEINNFLEKTKNPTQKKVEEVIAKSLNKNRLSLEETAVLINANSPELIDKIKNGAKKLKQLVYGQRIVLFAPLYVGNLCVNNCKYCGYKQSNKSVKRVTLGEEELIKQVESLEETGQKRLIMVYGEHPKYSPEFIAKTVQIVYKVKKGPGEIRRVNINAAPLDIEGFRTVKESEIGTYQVFQETYHHKTYSKVHPSGIKSNYDWRLTALDRAQEAGIDDVGIGALFGLYDWRFEVMGILRHVNHFEAVYKVGPHTISFPRVQNASGLDIDKKYLVNDEDFTKLVAILRLAVPYTGMILTARESVDIRNEIMEFGISQIDGGTNIEMGGYSEDNNKEQDLDKEQFQINDNRSLGEIIEELIEKDHIPSFCTACYRVGRTGEHFMEFSVPGFIKRYCQPNAILTMVEYLEDYANESLKTRGYKMICNKVDEYKDAKFKSKLVDRIDKIKKGERDLYF